MNGTMGVVLCRGLLTSKGASGCQKAPRHHSLSLSLLSSNVVSRRISPSLTNYNPFARRAFSLVIGTLSPLPWRVKTERARYSYFFDVGGRLLRFERKKSVFFSCLKWAKMRLLFCVLNMLLIVAVFEYVVANHRSVEALLLLPLLLL